MVSAFALFNALLPAYSRIPRARAGRASPGSAGRTDGAACNAVLVSGVAYSLFAILPFGGLLAGDVLLYTAALALEFAALLKLRRSEPELRGPFRVPLSVPGLAALAALPILVIVGAVILEVRSHEIGLPGVFAAIALALAGLVWYRVARESA
jgi:amino acid transporter